MLKPQAAFKKLQFKKAIENKIMNDSIHSIPIKLLFSLYLT